MATIVIADDDAASRLLLMTLLEHAGHVVAAVASGGEAFEATRRMQPDLLLTDLGMPGFSGAELVRALRKDSVTRGIKIALYTATPSNAALRDFMEMYGIASILSKPVEPELALHQVAKMLEG